MSRSPRGLQRAIREMEVAREIHVFWRDELTEDPARGLDLLKREEVGGDVSWHAEWIACYDRVLAILRTLR